MSLLLKQLAQAGATNFQALLQSASGIVAPGDQLLACYQSIETSNTTYTTSALGEYHQYDSSCQFTESKQGKVLMFAIGECDNKKSGGITVFKCGYTSGSTYSFSGVGDSFNSYGIGDQKRILTSVMVSDYYDVLLNYYPCCGVGLLSSSPGGSQARCYKSYMCTMFWGQRKTW